MLPGVYNVSLIVDSKSIETRPLRVMADPEVSLTEVERKRMYEMAMEMHDLQKRVSDINSAFTAVNRQIPVIQKTMEGRSDLPAEVKSSFESADKSLLEMTAKLAPPAGGRGGGGGGVGRRRTRRRGRLTHRAARPGKERDDGRDACDRADPGRLQAGEN